MTNTNFSCKAGKGRVQHSASMPIFLKDYSELTRFMNRRSCLLWRIKPRRQTHNKCRAIRLRGIELDGAMQIILRQ